MKKVGMLMFMVVGILIAVYSIVDVYRYPEWYLSDKRSELRTEIQFGNESAIQYYEDTYVNSDRDVFCDDFCIRDLYLDTRDTDADIMLLSSGSKQLKSLGIFTITAYCPCRSCSGKWGRKTATGKTARANHTVAVDPKKIPHGTVLIIDGKEYVAEDCGGAIKGNKIDIFFDTHKETLQWGKRKKEVFVYVEQK